MNLSDTINAVIASAAILTLFSQLIQSRRNTDFTFQPKFKLKKFCNHDYHEWTPMLCDGSSENSTNRCNKDHWFNIKNESIGVAFKSEVFLVHKKEIKKFEYKDIESNRVLKLNALIQDGSVQYKLSQGIIPVHYYNQKENDSFYVVVSYETISRFNRFIQVVELGYEPKSQVGSIVDWKGNIKISDAGVVYFEKIGWINKIFKSNQKTYLKALKRAEECQNDLG